jgi:SAM-dependent methyltransferase
VPSNRETAFDVGADAYDRFMGRYSRRLAPLFADFALVESLWRVLDVGAGAGALAAELVSRVGAAKVAAAEPSEQFVAVLNRSVSGIDVRRAPAEDLPWEDASFDAVLAQLVIGFVGDAAAATAEMARVVRPEGVVALCMWDEDGLDLTPPLRAAREVAVPPDAPPPPQLPFRSENALGQLLEEGRLRDVETGTLEVTSEYASFDEFWNAALGMSGPDTEWTRGLDRERLAAGREAAYHALGSPAGAFALRARAVAARATRR